MPERSRVDNDDLLDADDATADLNDSDTESELSADQLSWFPSDTAERGRDSTEVDHQPFEDEDSCEPPSASDDVPFKNVADKDYSSGPQSVFTKLVEYGLLRRMTDIVLAKAQVPPHLRADAIQEIHTMWASLEANPMFQRNQLGRYAYISGDHAALYLRRKIGAVVVIPGALFRSGRDSFFMQSIGAALSPKDVDEYSDSIELSVEHDWLDHSRVSESYLRTRLAGLTLSAKQRKVVHMVLVDRTSVDDVAEALGMPVMYVERLLNQVTAKLRSKDGLPSRAPRSNVKKRKPRTPKEAKVSEPADEKDEE